MEFESILGSVMDFRANYPEVVSALIGVLGFLALYGVRRILTAAPLSPEAKSLADMLGCKDRWRWGVKGQNLKKGIFGTPTGNSIVCQGSNGQKIVALLKDKYTVDGEAIDLSKADLKRLRKLRNAVVASLTASDKAREAREQAKARQTRYQKLISA